MNQQDWDRQIRDALRVEPSADQVARLERFWRRESLAQGRRRMWRVAAVAATFLIAASLGTWYGWHSLVGGPQGNKLVEDAAPPANDREGRETDVADAPPSQHVQPTLSAGRPATAYERMVFLSRSSGSMNSPRAGQGGDVDALIDRFAGKADIDAEQIAAAAGLSEPAVEKLLMRRLFRSDDEQKSAVMRLLAVCGSERSTPALLRLGRREEFRESALSTVERIVGVDNLAGQLDQTTDRRVRAALIRRLLLAESDTALRGYLSLVHDPGSRAEALAAADQFASVPLDALLARLDDGDRGTRVSAALVLGHVNGPEVTGALIDRVTRQPEGGVEAWIALLACRGETAEGFLSFASRRPKMLAHVNSAHMEWLRLIQ